MENSFFSKQARLNVSVLVVRIGMSFPFIFAGLNHIMHPEMAMTLGVPGGIIFASIGALEVILGIGILLGLLTRPSALFQAFIMLTTIFVLAKGDVGNPSSRLEGPGTVSSADALDDWTRKVQRRCETQRAMEDPHPSRQPRFSGRPKHRSPDHSYRQYP
ncbi:MAG: DoxX family membrane protein [Candidatus Bathyarchaeia archaeon]